MKKSYHLLMIGLTLILLSPALLKAQIYVKPIATGDGTGSSWANATSDLQAAINAANLAYAGDPAALPTPIVGDGIIKQIWVAAGTYEAPAVSNFYHHMPIPYSRGFVMKNGVEIYGGFDGTEGNLSQRNWKTNVTILTGNNTHRVVTNYYNPPASPLTQTAVLDGFTITNGKGVGDESATAAGGGIYNFYASPTLRNLIITNNTAGTGNTATTSWDGGGIFNDFESGPIISNTIISNNTAMKSGGGVANQNSNAKTPKFYNVLITGNTAHRFGGGAFNFNLAGTLVYTNVTITGNNAVGDHYNGSGGGGAGGSYSGNDAYTIVQMNNSIIWGNTGKASVNQPNITNTSPGKHIFKNSLVQGSGGSGAWVATFGDNGGGNIDANPQFVGGSDFSLQSISPALNTGSDVLYPGLNASTTDLAGNPRKYSTSNIDMGAYEYQGTLPVSLIRFTAKANGNSVLLQWQTASETSNKGFVIYRSGDNNQFEKIGERPALATFNYAFTDNSPLNGTNYYKLVQVDDNGTTTDLDVQAVNFSLSVSDVDIYPNPTEDQLTVSFEAGKFSTVALVNSNGKILQSVLVNSTENSKTLSLGAYPAGIYIITLSGATDTEHKKIIKK